MNLLDALQALVKDNFVCVDDITAIKQLNPSTYICKYFNPSKGVDTIFKVRINPDIKSVYRYDFNPLMAFSEGYTELDELTHGKTIEQLESEIAFQLLMGENKGGTIVSALQHTLNNLKNSQK
jgi:hypothetical protein